MKIRRGEVWRVNLSSGAHGAEIRKSRPSVVVNSDEIAGQYVAVLNNDAIGVLPLKIIVPLSRWQDRYHAAAWHVPVDPCEANGLRIKSTADTFQVRSISEKRFVEKIGVLSDADMEAIQAGLAICLDFDK